MEFVVLPSLVRNLFFDPPSSSGATSRSLPVSLRPLMRKPIAIDFKSWHTDPKWLLALRRSDLLCCISEFDDTDRKTTHFQRLDTDQSIWVGDAIVWELDTQPCMYLPYKWVLEYLPNHRWSSPAWPRTSRQTLRGSQPAVQTAAVCHFTAK